MYNASVWLRRVEEKQGEPLPITWRSFPLEQINNKDEGWLFWEQPVDEVRSLLGFLAAETAREQGREMFEEFRHALLLAVHERKLPLHDFATIEVAAKQVPGLDLERLGDDTDRPELRERIERDYREAVELYGIFGTPTLRFGGGDVVFLNTQIPPEEDSLSLFATVREIATERPYVGEIKKPKPPERS